MKFANISFLLNTIIAQETRQQILGLWGGLAKSPNPDKPCYSNNVVLCGNSPSTYYQCLNGKYHVNICDLGLYCHKRGSVLVCDDSGKSFIRPGDYLGDYNEKSFLNGRCTPGEATCDENVLSKFYYCTNNKFQPHSCHKEYCFIDREKKKVKCG